MQALWIVRQFPRQILRDLDRYHNRRIADWWRGTRGPDGELILPSYDLLAYLEFMDEEGEFKALAERGGRWPTWKQMLAELTNEQYRMRSSYFAVNSEDGERGFDTKPLEFRDPVAEAEHKRRNAEAEQSNAKSQDAFESALGY